MAIGFVAGFLAASASAFAAVDVAKPERAVCPDSAEYQHYSTGHYGERSPQGGWEPVGWEETISCRYEADVTELCIHYWRWEVECPA